MIRHKGILSMRHNDVVEVTHDGICLNMEVPHNSISPSASYQIDDVAVNSCAEEHHCAHSLKGQFRYTLGLEPEVWAT